MRAPYPWHKFDLHRYKVILVALLLLAIAGEASAQQQGLRWVRKNNPNYDKRKLSYGFLIGLHTSSLQIKYSDRFVTTDLDTVLAVQPAWSTGFSLGFIVNYRLADLLDVRLTPKVSFYEHRIRYLYTDRTQPMDEQLIEKTMVEFPVLLKYKSERRGNIRMYMIGGVNPAIEASGKKDIEANKASLEIKEFNFNLEVGVGFDLYYPLFKFSPEIRYSRGIINTLGNTNNIYGQPLKYVNTNTISVYFLFQ